MVRLASPSSYGPWCEASGPRRCSGRWHPCRHWRQAGHGTGPGGPSRGLEPWTVRCSPTRWAGRRFRAASPVGGGGGAALLWGTGPEGLAGLGHSQALSVPIRSGLSRRPRAWWPVLTADPVQAVLDRPVTSGCGGQPRGPSLFRGTTRDRVGGLGRAGDGLLPGPPSEVSDSARCSKELGIVGAGKGRPSRLARPAKPRAYLPHLSRRGRGPKGRCRRSARPSLSGLVGGATASDWLHSYIFGDPVASGQID